MQDSAVTLPDLVRDWMANHPKLKEHYFVASHTPAAMTLHWIQCKCKAPGALPPTPIYDFLIMDDHITAWRMLDKLEEAKIMASDPNFFNQLEDFLSKCHTSVIY